MRILSQDKRYDININDFYIQKSFDDHQIFALNDAILGTEGIITLGYYQKQRIDEVMQEIRLEFSKPNSDKRHYEMPKE